MSESGKDQLHETVLQDILQQSRGFKADRQPQDDVRDISAAAGQLLMTVGVMLPFGDGI